MKRNLSTVLIFLFLIIWRPVSAETPNIFLEAELTPAESYLQSQSLYTVRLFYAAQLQDGTLTDPSVADVIMLKLGTDKNYQVSRDGHVYQVIERRYALFPQMTGTLLITPAEFMGQMSAATSTAASADDLLNNSASLVHLTAPAITMNVRPKPATASKGWWLPAQRLSISESWSSQPPQFRLGQPITRTIIMEATGVMANQLPDFSQDALPHVKTYSDHSCTEIQTDGSWITAKRIINIVYIPTTAGAINIPALQIPWWNTQKDKPEIASLSAHNYAILAGSELNKNPQSTVGIADITRTSAKNLLSAKVKIVRAEFIDKYRWFILLSVVSLLIVLLICFYRKSYVKNFHTPENNLRRVRRALKSACKRNQPQAVKQLLLQWAALIWPQQKILSLGELLAYIETKDLSDAIMALDKLLYANYPARWHGKSFWQLFSHYMVKATAQKKNSSGPFPELYPSEGNL